jgi:hypothetical protein
MKILLDENLPHELRHEISGHDVFTVKYLGWSGMKNGLLKAAIVLQVGSITINDNGRYRSGSRNSWLQHSARDPWGGWWRHR